MSLTKIDFHNGCPYATEEGLFYYAADVEPILNSLQQLKAEILPVLEQSVSMLRDYKREDVIILLSKLMAKLSAV